MENPKILLRNHKEFYLALFLCLIPFFFVWLRGRLFYDFDMTFITAPIEDMFARYQRAGKLPLWAPELQMGYPLIAISHLGFFYPLHVFLREFLPGVLTLNISLFFHAILAFSGMYGLLRHEKYEEDTSALAAFIFTGTGFFVSRYYLTNVILPFSWIPLNLLLLGLWLKKRSFSSLAGLSFAIAMQILLGQPQAALIGAVALSFYCVSHLVSDFKKYFLRVFPLIPAAGLTILLAYMQIQPTLALVPFSDRSEAMMPKELYEFNFPFYHLLSWVMPHAFGYHQNYIGAKNETELGSWLGVVVLAIFLIGVFYIKKMHRIPMIFSLLVTGASLLMIVGESSPFYRYLVENHWLDTFGIPARWLLLLLLGIIFLTAHGAEQLKTLDKKRSKTIIIAALFIILLTATAAWYSIPEAIKGQVSNNIMKDGVRSSVPFIAALLVYFIATRKKNNLIIFLLLAATFELLFPNLTRNVSVPFSQPFVKTGAEKILEKKPSQNRLFTQKDLTLEKESVPVFRQLKRLDKSFKIEQSFINYFPTISGVNLDLRWGKFKPHDFLVELSVTDLNTGEKRIASSSAKNIRDGDGLIFRFARPFTDATFHSYKITISTFYDTGPGPWAMYAAYLNGNSSDFLPGGSANYCRTECSPFEIPNGGNVDLSMKIISNDNDRIRLAQDLLSPHIAAGKNITSTQWLGALQLREVKRYLYDIGDQNENADGFNPFIKDRRELVNRLGIDYLLGSYRNNLGIGEIENLELISEYPSQGQTVRLFKNLSAAPRIEFVTNVSSVTHPDGARADLFSAKSKSDPTPVQDDATLKGIVLSAGKVKIISEKSDEIIIQTENDGQGFLVLRDTYFPDWKAYVNGRETRIFPSDWIFRGILLPAGNHTVIFKYEPTNTLRAVKISFSTWVISLTAVFFYFLRRREYLLFFFNAPPASPRQ